MSKDDDFGGLVSRLQRLEDERAILETLHRYGHCLDYGLEDEWLDLFTDDALFHFIPNTEAISAQFERRSRLPTRREGKAALASFAAHHSRPPERLHKHLLLNPVIAVKGDEAKTTSYFLRIDASPNDTGAYITTFGSYTDTLVRSSDGKWRFRRRIAEGDAFIDKYAETGGSSSAAP